MTKIPFNKSFVAGKELYYIAQAVTFGNLAGDGRFTQRCSRLLKERFGVDMVLLVPSCTSALEMAAMLFDLRPGDEVIVPSFTFVSTVNAFVRLGAKPVFVDIRPDTLNLNESLVEEAITERTRAIFPVHYAGIGCEMDRIMSLAQKYGLKVAEDAAQGVNAFYNGRALGSIGSLGCYSFHETKNFICGEGGALCLNAPEVSGPAAKAYLNEAQFERAGVRVRFMEYDGYPAYPQLYPPFEHGVSVLDLLLMVGPRAPEYLERVRHAA